MRRLVAFLLRNWPLKLGALALTTVLYGGVVLSENTRLWPGQVPIDVLSPPQNAAVLTNLPAVTGIQYRAPLEVASQLTNGSFRASIDLSNVTPVADGPPIEVPVRLLAIDGRVQIIDYNPQTVKVVLDPVDTRTVVVTVDHGTVPGGLTLGPAQVEPSTVRVRGASSRLLAVRTVSARVIIDATAIDVDQEVDLLPLDETGNVVPGVELTPERGRVRISVARQLAFATVPIVPELTGEVGAGYEITSIAADPLTVSVSGEESVIEALGAVHTALIDITGRTGTFEVLAELAPPSGVTIGASSTIRVSVAIEPAEGSRSYEVGVELLGAQADQLYHLSITSVLVVLSGPLPALDALDVSRFRAMVDVADLAAGTASVPVTVVAPTDLEVQSVTPSEITVTISPAPTPSPTPDLLPSGEPSPSPSPSPSAFSRLGA
ncbi:MAG: CdaR family protein [Candidatus Limnocylindrales bacterium]